MATKNERIKELEKTVHEQDEMIKSIVYDISKLISEVHELKSKNKQEYLG